ncbi:hypothetical protein [Streptomyces vilmorinianum]|uniref:hypothetical protein n=1 Tax=Streptomyces vilmorinianum TaxID=3051092 RepID=UPI0010FB5897|nr:hypothetical protein [Streptomyces vilmorinianum]
MPQLPEDIIDRLVQMERRIQALSTAVNTRPALNEVIDGALTVRRTVDNTVNTILQIGSSTASNTKPVIRINDGYNHEIFSDDILTGGLARPWLALLPPQDVNQARWPSTTATAFTAIARSANPIWQPKLRLVLNTRVSSGATGQVRVMVDGAQFGPTVNAGTTFDHTGPVTTDMQSRFGSTMTVEVQAMVSSGGTVYAQTHLMHGTQT